MHPIKLTDTHKSKLLEMCEKLFLDKNHTWFKINLDGEILWVNKKAGIEKIHWFEFVMCYLVEAIQNALPEELVWRKMYGCVGEGNWTLYSHFLYIFPKNCRTEHPIDWLYTEFQNIKK